MDKGEANDYLGNLNQEIYRKKQEINHEHDMIKRMEALYVEAMKESTQHQEEYQNLGVILGMTATEYDKSLKMKESMENEYTELMCELEELTETIERKTQLKNKMDTHYMTMKARFDEMTKHKIERRNELLNSLQRDRPADQIKLFKPIVPVRVRSTARASTSAADTTSATDDTTSQETAKQALQELKQLGLFNFNYGRGIGSEEVPELLKTKDKENSAQDVAMDYFVDDEENQINSLANSSKPIDDENSVVKISMAEIQKTSANFEFIASKKTTAPPAEVNSKKIPLSIQDNNRMENASENASGLLENEKGSCSVFEDNNKENSALQTQILQGQLPTPPIPIQQQKQSEEIVTSDVEDFKIPNDPEHVKYGAGFFDHGGFNFFNNSIDTQSSSSGESDLDFFKWTGGASTSENANISSGNSNFLFF